MDAEVFEMLVSDIEDLGTKVVLDAELFYIDVFDIDVFWVKLFEEEVFYEEVFVYTVEEVEFSVVVFDLGIVFSYLFAKSIEV